MNENERSEPVTRTRLPFCELHVHLEGTLEPGAIFDLAERKGLSLPHNSRAELSAAYEFADLSAFLDLYYQNMSVLTHEDDFEQLAYRYLARAHQAGVAHAEVFVDPQAHLVRGVSVAILLRGVTRGIEAARIAHGITASVIVCVLRDHSVASAAAMLDDVLASGYPVVGIGLDSAEVGYPPSLFRSVFATARDGGLRAVAHAGEEGPPDYIWQALDELGAERIDHGVRCLEDDALVTRLVNERIPLTLCPLSNVRLRVVDTLADLPLRQMLDRGLVVTLNSDDPAYFGGYFDDTLAACIRSFGLSPGQVLTLARNSIDAAFLGEGRRLELLSQL
jgi:adenosine deaminase